MTVGAPCPWPQFRESRVRREFSVIEGSSAGTHGMNTVGLPDVREFTVTGSPPRLLLGSVLFEFAVEQGLSDGRVSAGGGDGQVEDQGQVQRIRSGRERLVQDAVPVDTVDADAVVAQVESEIDLADRPGSEGSLSCGDQDVLVRGVWPCNAALVESGPQRPVGQFAQALGVSGDRDAPVG